MGFKPMTSAILVQCSTEEASQLGAGHIFQVHNTCIPIDDEECKYMKLIYICICVLFFSDTCKIILMFVKV